MFGLVKCGWKRRSDKPAKQGYPFVSAQEQAHIISALDCVDFVVVFTEDSPQKLIDLIKPPIVVRGEGLHLGGCIKLGHNLTSYGGEVKTVGVAVK